MFKINYVNQYDDEKSYKKTIKKALKTAFKYLKIKERTIINIILVNDNEIQELNKTYRNLDKSTDVLSFENDDYSPEIGDVFISIDKTKEQAESYNHSFARELAFLTIHGFLHCLGYDHLNEKDELEMFSLQEKILEQAGFRRELWKKCMI